MTKISILGSTGSIGRNCLEVVARSKNKWEVVGLSAGRNIALFQKQVAEFCPKIISLEREEDAAEFHRIFPDCSSEIFHGQEGAEAVARVEENDIVVSAITGINGLRPTLGAVQAEDSQLPGLCLRHAPHALNHRQSAPRQAGYDRTGPRRQHTETLQMESAIGNRQGRHGYQECLQYSPSARLIR